MYQDIYSYFGYLPWLASLDEAMQSFLPVTTKERTVHENGIINLLAAVAAAASSDEQNGMKYPKYLQVTSDYYTCWGSAVQRNISYELMDNTGMAIGSGIITEHLFPTDTTEPVITTPGINTSFGEPTGIFDDQISTQWGFAREYDQNFTVTGATLGLAGFLNIPVFVRTLGGIDYGVLHIVKTYDYVDINGDRGNVISCR